MRTVGHIVEAMLCAAIIAILIATAWHIASISGGAA